MSRQRISVLTPPEKAPVPQTEPALRGLPATARDEGPAAQDDAIHKLSKRLWSLEIHRRLERQARDLL